MLWLFITGILVILSATVGLLFSLDSQRKLKNGTASWDELADWTGILEPESLRQLPGVSVTDEGNLQFNPDYLHSLPRTRATLLLDSPARDIVSIAVASVTLAAAGYFSIPLWPPLVMVAFSEVAGWIYAGWGAWKRLGMEGWLC